MQDSVLVFPHTPAINSVHEGKGNNNLGVPNIFNEVINENGGSDTGKSLKNLTVELISPNHSPRQIKATVINEKPTEKNQLETEQPEAEQEIEKVEELIIEEQSKDAEPPMVEGQSETEEELTSTGQPETTPSQPVVMPADEQQPKAAEQHKVEQEPKEAHQPEPSPTETVEQPVIDEQSKAAEQPVVERQPEAEKELTPAGQPEIEMPVDEQQPKAVEQPKAKKEPKKADQPKSNQTEKPVQPKAKKEPKAVEQPEAKKEFTKADPPETNSIETVDETEEEEPAKAINANPAHVEPPKEVKLTPLPSSIFSVYRKIFSVIPVIGWIFLDGYSQLAGRIKEMDKNQIDDKEQKLKLLQTQRHYLITYFVRRALTIGIMAGAGIAIAAAFAFPVGGLLLLASVVAITAIYSLSHIGTLISVSKAINREKKAIANEISAKGDGKGETPEEQPPIVGDQDNSIDKSDVSGDTKIEDTVPNETNKDFQDSNLDQ